MRGGQHRKKMQTGVSLSPKEPMFGAPWFQISMTFLVPHPLTHQGCEGIFIIAVHSNATAKE